MDKYLIQKVSNCPLFMADRNKTKSFWWTYKLSYAMQFTSMQVALDKKNTLKFGSFRVITLNEARSIRQRADDKHEERIDRLEYMNDQDPGDTEYWNNKDY